MKTHQLLIDKIVSIRLNRLKNHFTVIDLYIAHETLNGGGNVTLVVETAKEF